MEIVPSKHEKRTLFAHLECRDVFVCMLILESLQEASVEPFCWTSDFKDRCYFTFTN